MRLVRSSSLPVAIALLTLYTTACYVCTVENATPAPVNDGRTLRTSADIDPEAEKRLRRKFDMRILPIIIVIYLFTFIDVRIMLFLPYRATRRADEDLVPQRANIGNARIAGLEKSLNLKGYDYNILLTS